MRRALRLLLPLALLCSSLPAGAQPRAAAPVRVVPALPLPRVAPVLAATPSVLATPSLAPSLSALPLAPAPLPAPAAAPARRELPAAGLAPSRAAEALANAASPAPLPAERIEALAKGKANDDGNGAAAALAALAATDPASAKAGLAFDGSRALPAAADAPQAGPGPEGPRLGKPSLYRRVFKKKVPTAYRAFTDGLGYAAILGGFGLAGWGVISWAHVPYVMVAGGIAAAGVLLAGDLARGAAWLVRKLARRPQPAPARASRPQRWTAWTAGALVGASLAWGVVRYQQPVIEAVHRRFDRSVAVAERQNVRAIAGPAFARETAAALSKNPVGRDILAQLEDRGGVLRMPHFYVLTEPDVLAQYNALSDGVYIDAGQITGLGYTVEQFLADPAVQREVVEALQSTLAHELTHTVQARRNPLGKDYWLPVMEHEYEAFVNELFYNHARLKADPKVELQPNDAYAYEAALNDLAGYLRELDGYASYKDNVHLDDARWRAWRADLFARWPAVRAEGYALLAERAKAKGQDRLARKYHGMAVEAARQAGLPPPAPLENR